MTCYIKFIPLLGNLKPIIMKTLLIPFLFICNMAIGQVWGTQPYPAADTKKTTFVNGLEWHQQPYGYDVNWT